MDPAAATGVAVWQLAALFGAAAIVIAGAAYFVHRWRAHDDAGRPRPPDALP
jgi:hypothetical protein